MSKFVLLFNTIKYLKFIQIYYRVFYFFRNFIYKILRYKYKFSINSHYSKLNLKPSIEGFSVYKDKEFTFLNLSKGFDDKIDWNCNEYGKLWTYNLNYFEYLHQESDIYLIHNFIDNIENIKDGLEAFPISLRTINWIKFLTKYNMYYKRINDSLYAQQYILLENLEYHLLGNHLLENGFALLFSSYYFQDKKLYKKAKNILITELDRQILDDGAHFELSPMYHQIMLFRVLDCINLVQNNNVFNNKLLEFLIGKAQKMLDWLNAISYQNGDIPHFNDSTNNITPNTKQLNNYANNLGIFSEIEELKDSGYRKFAHKNYECIIDVADIKSSYIAGHTHSDILNFELRLNNKKFIVDTGISTYENDQIRAFERSTKAHNCVEINNTNSSDIWSSFRVSSRAKIIELKEKKNKIIATHNGYKKYGILHTREWIFKDQEIIIKDSLNTKSNAIFRLHFHPNVDKNLIKQNISSSKTYTLSLYNYALGFNKCIEAIVLEIKFEQDLQVMINL